MRNPKAEQKIIRLCARQYWSSPELVMSKSQRRLAYEPRQMALAMMAFRLGYAYREVAEVFGCSESAVSMGIRRMRDRVDIYHVDFMRWEEVNIKFSDWLLRGSKDTPEATRKSTVQSAK